MRYFGTSLELGLARHDVLDVGCGVGTLALYLGQFAKSVKGVDVASRAIKIATKAARSLRASNVTFVEGELAAVKGKFELIMCTEVIEHVADDAAFAKQLASRLKEGGLLFLTTPSMENWLYKLGYYRGFDAEVGHFRRYTPMTIRQRLEQAGLTVLKVEPVEGPLRSIMFSTKLGYLIYGIKGPLIPLFHWFDSICARVFGASDLQVIARKP